MQDLIDFIHDAEYLVVFTGAGVSTLSGIRDFRGKNGIYRDVDADRIFDIGYFRRDPAYFYSHSRELIYDLQDKQPSLVHLECARLEKLGRVRALITQNIDLLHEKAGSRHVIGLHGTPSVHRCLECGKTFSFEWTAAIVRRGEVPYCGNCAGLVKPDITFFGEYLDESALYWAMEESSKADAMLVLGSSLIVYPAASMPLYTLQGGGRLAIINQGETPHDALACCRYDDLEACFQAIAESF